MREIIRKHKRDVFFKENKCWIFGFVEALMQLLVANPNLDLPRDLSRIRILSNPTTDGNSFRVLPRTVDCAKNALLECESQIKKKIVFFIDEFTADKTFPAASLVLFRRNLMDIQGVVVCASTDSGAVYMMNSAASTPASFDFSGPWVFLFTKLPRYVPEIGLKNAVTCIQNEGIKKLLSMCLSSRPRFVAAALEQIRHFSASPDQWSQSDAVIDFVENLRTTIVRVFRGKS
jgi:hypothetical protein